LNPTTQLASARHFFSLHSLYSSPAVFLTPESEFPLPIECRNLQIHPDSALIGARADRAVQQMIGRSRSFVTGLFDHDCVHINGQLEIHPGRPVRSGDLIQVRCEKGRNYSPRKRPELHLNRGFQIVFEDPDLIVVDKEAKLLTVPTDGREPHTLVSRVGEYLRRTSSARAAQLVHRLDRGVSGLLVFAKTPAAAEHLQEQFSKHTADRRYEALTAGSLPESSGSIRSYLTTGKNLSRYSTRDANEGELAITHWKLLARFAESTRSPAVSRLQIRLETGRRNQIRVHLAEAGHPVLGDPRYRPELLQDIPWREKRLALHAAVLGFIHPRTQQPLSFESQLPPEFNAFLKFIGR
jgi:23S rRNA pseudouridine1911/1915/1917 synthase